MNISELAYFKLLQEHQIEESGLNQEIRDAIKDVKDQLNSINHKASKDKEVSADSLAKLKRRDMYAVGLILDYLDSRETQHGPAGDNSTTPPAGSQNNEGATDDVTVIDDDRGYTIDRELGAMYKEGLIADISMAALKKSAPVTESVIFASYSKDGDNGVETSNFRIVETAHGTEIFTLTKL